MGGFWGGDPLRTGPTETPRVEGPARTTPNLKTAPGDIGYQISFPFRHPGKFFAALKAEVAKAPKIGKGLAAIGRQAQAKLSGRYDRMSDKDAERFAQQNIKDIRESIPIAGNLLDPYLRAASPGETGEQARQELLEHPAVPLTDLATAFAPAAKAGAFGKGAQAVSQPLRSATRAIVKTETGARAVVNLKSATAGLREVLPSPRAGVTKAVPQAVRRVEKIVSDRNKDIAPILDPLDEMQRAQLRQSLARGLRPDDEIVGPAYDVLKPRIEGLEKIKLTLSVPESAKQVLKDRLEAKTWEPLARVVGHEAARQMLDAFVRDQPNPIPSAEKAWNRLQREWRNSVDTETARLRVKKETPLEGVGEQVYSVPQAAKVRALQRRLERGVISQEAYDKTIQKMVPGAYRPALEEFDRAKRALRERLRFEPGFGAGTYRRLLDELAEDLEHSWVELAQQGMNPVFQHRAALRRFDDPRQPTVRATTRQAGSLKPAERLAEKYHDDPWVMFNNDELDLVNQYVMTSTLAQVYQRTGGGSYARVSEKLQSMGYTPEQAHKLIRSDYRSFSLRGEFSAPNPGDLLIRRDVARAFEHHFGQRTMKGFSGRFLDFWMVPTLWLSPRFHVNNIVGGAAMLAATETPVGIARQARAGVRMVLRGELPTDIPVGMLQGPTFQKAFKRSREAAVQEGKGLAGILQRSGHSLIESSQKLNAFFDQMYRAIVYLERARKGKKRGLSPQAAEAEAIRAASSFMQNWDSMAPIEREVFQRLMPFWGFKRVLLRYAIRYPIDHPVRMTMNAIAARDAMLELDPVAREFDNLVPVGAEREDGSRLYINARSLNPFGDMSNLLTLSGFLSSLHPLPQTGLEVLGVEPIAGGVVPYGEVETDPVTGDLIKKPRPEAVLGLVGFLEAGMQAAGLVRGLPAPEDQSLEGWLQWSRRYWSKLGLPAAPTVKNIEEAYDRYQRNLDEAEESKEYAEERRMEQEVEEKDPNATGFWG